MPQQALNRACGCSERPCPHPAPPPSSQLGPSARVRVAQAKSGASRGRSGEEGEVGMSPRWLPPRGPRWPGLASSSQGHGSVCGGGASLRSHRPGRGSVTADSSCPLSPEGGNGFLGATWSLVSALTWSPPRKCPFAEPSPVARLAWPPTGSDGHTRRSPQRTPGLPGPRAACANVVRCCVSSRNPGGRH